MLSLQLIFPVNLMPNHFLILVPGGVNVIGEGSIQYVMLLERELFVTYKLVSMLEVILLVIISSTKCLLEKRKSSTVVC